MLSIFDQGPAAPCPDSFNMAQYVLARAKLLAGKTMLSIISPESREDWTFRDIETAVRGVATGLLQQGLKPNDRILMRLGNTPEFPILFLAAISVGIIPVPTSAQLTTPEIDKICEDLKPNLIVAGENIALPTKAPCPIITAATLQDFHSLAPAFFQTGEPNRLAYIIYTSGTAGKPRAVCHAHRAIWARRMMLTGWYGLTAHDKILHAGAFNWTYTLGTGLMDPLTIGSHALIPAPNVTPAQLPELMRQHNVNIFAAAPGVYRQILKHPLPNMPNLRHGLSAGEKLPDSTRDAWQAATDTPIFEAYGLSECSTFISAHPKHPAPKGTSGFPQAGRRVAIVDLDGQPVQRGQAGVLAIDTKDQGLMLGYLNAAEETNERIKGAWFLTGDTCLMDANDAITYLGRDDDMMNAGGFRVSPLEVETALAQHPEIHEIAAVEIAVKADVSVIAAFYTSDAPLDETTLLEYATSKLARYKTPRIFKRVAEIPKGANGKLQRRILRETFEADK